MLLGAYEITPPTSMSSAWGRSRAAASPPSIWRSGYGERAGSDPLARERIRDEAGEPVKDAEGGEEHEESKSDDHGGTMSGDRKHAATVSFPGKS